MAKKIDLTEEFAIRIKITMDEFGLSFDSLNLNERKIVMDYLYKMLFRIKENEKLSREKLGL